MELTQEEKKIVWKTLEIAIQSDDVKDLKYVLDNFEFFKKLEIKLEMDNGLSVEEYIKNKIKKIEERNKNEEFKFTCRAGRGVASKFLAVVKEICFLNDVKLEYEEIKSWIDVNFYFTLFGKSKDIDKCEKSIKSIEVGSE